MLQPRLEFEKAVQDHQAHLRVDSRLEPRDVVLPLRAHSLREIERGRETATSGVGSHVPDWQLYQTVGQLLEKCQGVAAQRGGKKFRFKNKLMSLDSSVIDLSMSLDWAKFRRTKGAIAAPVLDHDGYLPSFAVITEGKSSDIKVARQMRFEPGTVLAMTAAIWTTTGSWN